MEPGVPEKQDSDAPVNGGDSTAQVRAPQVWKLLVAYDGTDFHGWQVQPNVRTVQGELARALLEVTGERVLPQGSGRTDAGVHAEGQAVSVELRAAIPCERLLGALNRRLPSAIRVVSAEHAHPQFHARANVVSKTYEYRVFTRRGWTLPALADERVLLPWQARFAWSCRHALSLERMQAAAGAVVGTFDFSSFAASEPDRATRLGLPGAPAASGNVRTVFRSEWLLHDGLLLYRVCGSGFLYHMVRNLVGTFIEVGMGGRRGDSLGQLIAARDRALAGPTAPPEGLFLMDVRYGEPVAVTG